MLVLKVFVNKNQIDEVHIQNTGGSQSGMEDDMYEYRIRKPEGMDDLVMYHRRSDGWLPLVQHALHNINRAKEWLD
jgi:hypothetical protein